MHRKERIPLDDKEDENDEMSDFQADNLLPVCKFCGKHLRKDLDMYFYRAPWSPTFELLDPDESAHLDCYIKEHIKVFMGKDD